VTEIREIHEDELDRWVDAMRAALDETDTAEGYLDWKRQSRETGWFLATDGDEDVGAAIGVGGWHAPDGIVIATWAERADATEGMYEVAKEAYPDIPGEEDAEMEPFEQWLSMDMQGAGDRPEATFVAFAGDEIVAYAKLSLSLARPTVAMHDITGVKRAWRGRGIAGALKAAEIAWAKENGYVRLETQNEERNEPIRRLNQRHGYVVEPGSITVRGPIGSAVRS